MSIYRLIPAKHLATDPELRDDPFREGVKEKDAAIKRMAWPQTSPVRLFPLLPRIPLWPLLARFGRTESRTAHEKLMSLWSEDYEVRIRMPHLFFLAFLFPVGSETRWDLGGSFR